MQQTLRIGITGSTGVLGRISVAQLAGQGHELSCLLGDIRDTSTVKAWLDEKQLDVILHYAAVVPINRVKEDPLHAYSVNTGGTLCLLDAIKKCSYRPWFFYASTCHIYQSKDGPIGEEDAVEPVSLYGWTKYLGERICLDVAAAEELPVCSGRIFSFYHESQKPPFLYPTMRERLRSENLNQPFFLYGADGQRDFLYAEDVCHRIHGLMQARSTGIYNIGSGKAKTIRAFVQSMSPQELKIETNEERSQLIANVDKLKNELERISYALDRK